MVVELKSTPALDILVAPIRFVVDVNKLYFPGKRVILLCEGEGKRSPQWKLNGEHYSAQKAFCFEINRSLWSLRARAERKPAFKHFLPLQYSKAYHVIRTKRIWCVKKKKKNHFVLEWKVININNLGAQKFVLSRSALVDQIRHWILIKTNSKFALHLRKKIYRLKYRGD